MERVIESVLRVAILNQDLAKNAVLGEGKILGGRDESSVGGCASPDDDQLDEVLSDQGLESVRFSWILRGHVPHHK